MGKNLKILDFIIQDDASALLSLSHILQEVEKVKIEDVHPTDMNYLAVFLRQPYRVEELLDTIPHAVYTLMQQGSVRPLIMMTTEQWDLFETFKWNLDREVNFNESPYKDFIKYFTMRDVPEENITWVLPDHNHVKQIEFLKDKGYDIKCKFIQFNSMAQLMIDVANSYEIKNKSISKYYSCLCKGRPRHNRFGMIYDLWQNDLLDKGNVSCEPYKEQTQTKGFDWLNDIVTTKDFMSNFSNWDIKQSEFKNILPIEYDGRQNDHWNGPEYNEANIFESAFVWIACETMKEQDGIFITEKTWKAIAHGSPFIINGDSGSLDYLHSMGYKTFADYWDESYDKANSTDKIKMITGIIKDLCSKDTNTINQMCKDMLPILKHNQDLLRNNRQHQNLIEELHNG
jgi:hypothetical protein|tara:strand:- start:512 stop:1711 length:1200 start_codon:yes stop_codon:yes gene_type:complete